MTIKGSLVLGFPIVSSFRMKIFYIPSKRVTKMVFLGEWGPAVFTFCFSYTENADPCAEACLLMALRIKIRAVDTLAVGNDMKQNK